MLRTMMKSKIHRATVTQADLHYVGSDPASPVPEEVAQRPSRTGPGTGQLRGDLVHADAR